MISNTTFYILVFSAFIVTFAIIAAGYYLASKDLKSAKPKGASKKFYIPEDKILEFYKLVDGRKTHEGEYKLWQFVEQLFPDAKGKGYWYFWSYNTPMNPYVELREERP